MIDTRLSDAFLVETCTHIFPVREILCDITPEYFIMACFQNVAHLVDNHILKALRSFLIKSQIDVDMMRFYITGAPARFHLPDCDTGYLHPHQFGFLPLITGTLWVSLFAILIALPFGLSVAIYMSEVANSRIRNLLKPIIELLSGIPSVVYGFFGLIVIVPFIQKVFNLPVGESGLAGSIVLAIMALPTIITVTEDAMRNCPRAMREASLALGASQWQTIYKVVIPYSVSGITSGVVLGIGRAIGETMAVLMVTGNAAVIPHTILEPLRTIPATIAAELGEAPAGGAHYEALFLLGVVLFFISLLINFTVEAVSARKR